MIDAVSSSEEDDGIPEEDKVVIVAKDGQVLPLHTAAARGKLEKLKKLLVAGSDVSRKDKDGNTALLHAAYNGHLECVTALQKGGADIMHADNDGATALHHASFNGHAEVAKTLLELGAVVAAADKQGGTALHNAAFNGHDKILAILVDAGASVSVKDGDGSTPLHYAAHNARDKAVKYLLQKGSRVEAQDKEGATSLHHACFAGSFEVAKMLLEQSKKDDSKTKEEGHKNKPLTKIVDKLGGTALMSAAFGGHLKIVNLLFDHGADINEKDSEGSTALHKAAFIGDLELVKALLERKADVNALDNEDSTPLHKASFMGQTQVVELLLKAGAKMNLQDKDGGTALLNAVYSTHLGPAALLIDAGADINKGDVKGRTPLHNAACFGMREATTLILDQQADKASKAVKADPNVVDTTQNTPLHLAAFNGHDLIISMLVDAGAKPKAVNNDGGTPLHYAAYRGHLGTCIYLVERGSDVNAADKKGLTPLHTAAASGKTDLAAFLLKKGAKVDSLDEKKQSPLLLAVKNNWVKTAFLLMQHGADFTNLKNKDGLSARELARKHKDKHEDMEAAFVFIAEEEKPFKPAAKARLFLKLDSRKQAMEDVDDALNAFGSVVSGEGGVRGEFKGGRVGRTDHPFVPHGFSYDLDDPVDVIEQVVKDVNRYGRIKTLSNLCRHMLLVPAHSLVANKIWDLVELFVHRAVLLKDDEDFSGNDDTKMDFETFKEAFGNRNRMDVDSKLEVAKGIEDALKILFPNFSQTSDDKTPPFLPKVAVPPAGAAAVDDAGVDIDDEENGDPDRPVGKKKFGGGGGRENAYGALLGDDMGDWTMPDIPDIAMEEGGFFDIGAFTSGGDDDGGGGGGGGPPPPPPMPGMPPPPPGMPGMPGMPPPPPMMMGLPPGWPALKKFAWEKIPPGELPTTFWKTVKVDGIKLDRKVLERHFTAKKGNEKDGKKKEVAIQLLDFKRAQNVGIFMSHMKKSSAEIRKAILRLDTKVFTLDTARSLFKLCPTTEEIDTLKSYKGEVDKLGPAERLFMDIMAIPRLHERLECFVYSLEFDSKLADAKADLTLVNTAVMEVGHNKALKQVLTLVLVIGNLMNQGTFAGDAKGFRFSSVLKMRDTRSNLGNFSLLHYLVSLLEEKAPKLLQVDKGMTHLANGMKERMQEVVAEMLNLKTGFALVEAEIDAHKGLGDTVFVETMGAFHKMAKLVLDTFEKNANQMQKSFNDLAIYYGDKGTDAVQTMFQFVGQFRGAQEENKVAKEMAERAKKKALDKATMQKRTGLVANTKAAIDADPATLMADQSHLLLRQRMAKQRATRTNRANRPGEELSLSVPSRDDAPGAEGDDDE